MIISIAIFWDQSNRYYCFRQSEIIAAAGALRQVQHRGWEAIAAASATCKVLKGNVHKGELLVHFVDHYMDDALIDLPFDNLGADVAQVNLLDKLVRPYGPRVIIDPNISETVCPPAVYDAFMAFGIKTGQFESQTKQ